jgi:SAM-dependent methyltransferase
VHHGEFRHPRLVEIYDLLCPWGPDDDAFLALIGSIAHASSGGAQRVLDLGCGTGRFTVALAVAGFEVTGIDPAAASLDLARTKPGADRVTWIEGSTSVVPDGPFDAAVMSSHVSQFMVDDHEWTAALGRLGQVLVPGGLLAFDSCDPDDRRWERWNPVDSRRHLVLSDGTGVEHWTEVTAVVGDPVPIVDFTHRYEFDDGTALVGTASMRFRTVEEIRRGLEDAGFAVERIVGGWHDEPVGAGDGELLVVARTLGAA